MEKEATDRDSTSVTPDANKLKGVVRRNSTGYITSRGSLSVASNSEGKTLSRYLRPSMSSCHDFCKHGKKDSTEAAGKHPFVGRSVVKNITRDKNLNEFENLNLGERSKKFESVIGASTPLKSQSCGYKINKKALLCTKETGPLDNHIKLDSSSPTQKSILSVTQVESLNPGGTKKGQLTEHNTTFLIKTSPGKPEIIKPQDTSPFADIDALGEPNVCERYSILHVKKCVTSADSNVTEKKTSLSVKKSISSAESVALMRKAPILVNKSILSARSEVQRQKSSSSKKLDQSAKSSMSLTRTTVVKPISVLNPLRSHIVRRNQKSERTNRCLSETGKKKVLKSPSVFSPPRAPSDGVSSMKQKRYGKVKCTSLKNQDKCGKAELDSNDIMGKTMSTLECKSESIELDHVQPKSEDRQTSMLYNMEEMELESEFSDPSEPVSEEVTECIALKNQEKCGKAEQVSDDIMEKTRSRLEDKSENIELELIHPKSEGHLTSSMLDEMESESEFSGDIMEKARSRLEHKSENIGLELIQPKSEGNLTSSMLDEMEEMESEFEFGDLSESVSEEELTEGEVDSLKVEEKSRHRRTLTVHPVEIFSKPHKLKFRKGKVVELQPENIGPRRLKFRKGRVLAEKPNVNGEVMKINVRRREVDGEVTDEKCIALKNQEKCGKAEQDTDDIMERTRSRLEHKSENNELEPIQPKSEGSLTSSMLDEMEEMESESGFSDPSESVSAEELTEGEVDSLKDEEKSRHRRTATVRPVEIFSKPHKLKFRKGKVVELQPENNDSRRLKFRKGRVLAEKPNVNGEVMKRNVRRTELDGPLSTDPDLETETVVLKHQDLQGKKDSQSLFNHVIEETATKLVETRKSKVKALVGAFETVISLQEIKPTQSELTIP